MGSRGGGDSARAATTNKIIVTRPDGLALRVGFKRRYSLSEQQ